MKFSRYVFVLLAIVASIVLTVVLFVQSRSNDGIWRFNFAPEAAPNVKSFVKISGKSIYNEKTGYGWLDPKGLLETGQWHGDKIRLVGVKRKSRFIGGGEEAKRS